MVRAALSNGSFSSSKKLLFGTSPIFFSLSLRSRRSDTRKKREPHVPPPLLPTLYFPCTFDSDVRLVTYRSALPDDLPRICKFVDYWLSGGAKRLGIPGAGADFFIPHGQQAGYLKYKTTCLAMYEHEIIGWSVKSKNETLIHLLVSAEYRGKGIGSHLLSILNPHLVRSKSDQSTGDPKRFYQKHGYEVIEAGQGKHKNIDILQHQEN